jgi:hypothetical protein
MVFAAVTTADAKKKKTDYTKHPGYIDFAASEFFGVDYAKIEVNLNENMIKLVIQFLPDEERELKDMLAGLKLVRVEVYERKRGFDERFETELAKAAKELDEKDWERIVRVRERDEQAYVYVKPSDNYEWIRGVVVLAMEDDEAVFVNIVGDIKPEDISRIGDHFDIDELDSIRYEIEKDDD